MTPQQLTEEYIFAHDLREASAKIYRAATKALLKHFGPTATVQEVDHRSVLGWRRKVLEQGLSKRSWNTYSNHLRTIWGYAIEHELVTHSQVNPFRKTTVIPPGEQAKPSQPKPSCAPAIGSTCRSAPSAALAIAHASLPPGSGFARLRSSTSPESG